MQASIHGLNLFYEDQGKGLPIVFLHGFPLDHNMWQHQVEALKDSYRVITPDLQGMGQSEVADDNISLEQYTEDVLALLDHLHIEKAVLGGFSMGGYVAFALLRKAPERFSALILANTKAEADAKEARKNRMSMAASLYEKGSVVAKDAMLPKLFTEETAERQPQLVEQISATIEVMNPEGLVQACLAMAFRKDAVDLLAEIHVPTLVIAGQKDTITPPEGMKEMADQIAHAQYHEIPDAAHLTPMEQPEAFNRILLDFVKQLG